MNILDYIEYLESQGYSEDEINAFVDEAIYEGAFRKENMPYEILRNPQLN